MPVDAAEPSRRAAGRLRTGAGRREARSLFGEILDWMLAPLLLLWPMSVMLTWLVAQDIANQPFDRALADAARHEVQHIQALAAPMLRAGNADPLASGLLPINDSRIHQLSDGQRRVLSGAAALPAPTGAYASPTPEVRFRDLSIDGRDLRVASLWFDLAGEETGEPLLLQLAEDDDKRSQLAAEIIKGVLLPQFVILPLAVLLLWLALSRGIAPLAELQRRIRQRDSSDLSPIESRDVPEELLPLVRALNDLLDRLGRSVDVQKRFLADAAHQLKTPLAGLRTQAELALRSLDGGPGDVQQVRRSLQQIERASKSATRAVNQLLAMARTENRQPLMTDEEVDLGLLAAEVVRDFVPKAMEKRIDLGFEDAPAFPPMEAVNGTEARLTIRGNAVLLREMICNLLDNALQYTPAGGTVTLRVIADPFGQVAVLQVEDSGPGIAPAERELVFDPFYRALGTQVEGSGLGLAIVREISRQHGAEVFLEDANLRHPPGLRDQACGAFGPGARFTLRFRLTAPAG